MIAGCAIGCCHLQEHRGTVWLKVSRGSQSTDNTFSMKGKIITVNTFFFFKQTLFYYFTAKDINSSFENMYKMMKTPHQAIAMTKKKHFCAPFKGIFHP